MEPTNCTFLESGSLTHRFSVAGISVDYLACAADFSRPAIQDLYKMRVPLITPQVLVGAHYSVMARVFEDGMPEEGRLVDTNRKGFLDLLSIYKDGENIVTRASNFITPAGGDPLTGNPKLRIVAAKGMMAKLAVIKDAELQACARSIAYTWPEEIRARTESAIRARDHNHLLQMAIVYSEMVSKLDPHQDCHEIQRALAFFKTIPGLSGVAGAAKH